MQRSIALALALLIMVCLLPTAAARAGVEEWKNDDAPSQTVTVDFLTEPLFPLDGSSNDVEAYYGRVVQRTTDARSGKVSAKIMDGYGNLIYEAPTVTSLNLLGERLFFLSSREDGLGAIYRDGRALTRQIYTKCVLAGDCVVALRKDGKDFFSQDGTPRTAPSLGEAYTALYLTKNGITVACKPSATSHGASDQAYFDVYVFDAKGREIANCGTALLQTDSWQDQDGLFWWNENYFVPYGSRNIVITSDGRILSKEQKIARCLYSHVIVYGPEGYRVTDLSGKQRSFRSDVPPTLQDGFIAGIQDGEPFVADGDGNLIAKLGETGYYKMESNGPILDEGSCRIPCQAVFFSHDEAVLYDFAEGKWRKFTQVQGGMVYSEYLLMLFQDERRVLYDLNGRELRELGPEVSLLEESGVFFMKDGRSTAYFITDPSGNPSTEKYYVQTRETLIHGLALARRGAGWYLVNAKGEELIAAEIKKMGDFLALETCGYPLLALYQQNGKQGVLCCHRPEGVCGGERNGVHRWVKQITDPATCVRRGGQGCYCAKCGVTKYEELPIDPEAHSPGKFLGIVTQPQGKNHGLGRFLCEACGQETTARLCAERIFQDMPAEGSFSHLPIDWACFNGITAGVSEERFAPDNPCTRGQVVTFLWRAAGKPEPKSSVNPFTDVAEGAFYYRAVLWAVEQGITHGLTDTSFGPGQTCTRGQVVTFLWRYRGKPAASGAQPAFTDVSGGAYYYKAMRWAVGAGVTKGVSDTSFAPEDPCTRAQVVTFLYRAAT